jgi:hypothetical protein
MSAKADTRRNAGECPIGQRAGPWGAKGFSLSLLTHTIPDSAIKEEERHCSSSAERSSKMKLDRLEHNHYIDSIKIYRYI